MYASFQGVGYAHFWIRFPMHENNFTDVLTWFVPRSAGCESAPLSLGHEIPKYEQRYDIYTANETSLTL